MSDGAETQVESHVVEQESQGKPAGDAEKPRLQPVRKASPTPKIDENFGAIPPSADAWKVERVRIGGGLEALSFPAPDGDVERSHWPISELSVQTLRDRWGSGEYRVEFRGAGGTRHIKYANTIKVNAPAPAPAPAAPTDPLSQALAVLSMADKKAHETVQMVAALAGLGGRREGGISEQTIALMLEKQKSDFALLLEKQENEHRRQRDKDEQERERLKREIEDLRREREEGDGGGALEAAGKGARAYRRGMSAGEFLMSFAAEHPEVAAKVAGQALQVAGPAAITLASKLLEKKAPAAAPVRQLRPVARETPPQPPQNAPKRPPEPATGLNAIATDPAPPAAQRAATGAVVVDAEAPKPAG